MSKAPKADEKPASSVPAATVKDALAFRDIMDLLRMRKGINDNISAKKEELSELRKELSKVDEAIAEFTDTGEKPAMKPEQAKAKNLTLFEGSEAETGAKREYANATHHAVG